MDAEYRIAPDLTIGVRSDSRNRVVGLTVTAGTNPDEALGGGCVTRISPRRTDSFPLSRENARAIASALMGAAAEV